MFFKKTPESLGSSIPRSRAWAKLHQQAQELRFSVKQWNYEFSPSLRSSQFGSLALKFEGVCRVPPLQNIEVLGDIEILEDGELPGMLSDHWENVPENVEGYGFVLSKTDAAAPPTVSFTLYCQPSAFEGIYRAFMVGFSGEKGSTMLSLKIDCPNNCGGDFWNDQWLSEWWRVVSWELYASSQIHDKPA